ncbi:MAG: phosphoribosyltransferase [Bacteroidetes bacterium]|nr:MAG: phosphoribosyltransferase [Bacteroidota bacterium]
MRNFEDRLDAGKKLATVLTKYKNNTETLVIGVIRGGLIVANEVAKYLELPLDFVIVRKIGCPDNRELGAGAITTTGEVIFKESILSKKQLTPQDFTEIIEEELKELKRRDDKFREYKTEQIIEGKTIIVVDDGIAMGVTLKAVIMSLKKQRPKKIILAVPISSPNGKEYLETEVNEIISFLPFQSFRDVEDFYEIFGDTTDTEVETILKSNRT